MSRRRAQRPWRRPPVVGFDRLHIFVPAIMSVGLVFWIVTLTRDLFRWQGARSRQRRARVAGRASAEFVLGGLGAPPVAMPGLRLRVSYLVTAAVSGGLALYVLIGATANYLREGGYVGDIAWLLVLSLVVSAVFGFVAGVALVVAVAWPHPPAVLHGILRATPLTTADVEEGGRPGWALATATYLTPVVAVVFTIMVGSARSALVELDTATADWAADQAWMHVLDPLGSGWVWAGVVGVLLMAGAAMLRCRALAVALPVSTVVGAAAVVLAARMVDRAAPVGSAAVSSYPSTWVALMTFVVGVAPVSLGIVLDRRRVVAPLRAAGSALVALVVLGGLHAGSVWVSDTIGGLLIGLSAALVVDWALAHHVWHEHCRGCPWAPPGTRVPLLSTIHLRASHHGWVRGAAHLTAAGAAVGLAVLALTASVPENPDGSMLGAGIQRPVQLALAALVSVAALVSWRWAAVGAVMLALAGTGLGVFAGLEYRPEVAVLMTVALMVPSVLLWLSWQHRRRHGEIAVLAGVTLLLIAVAWFGAQEVYGHYFGATHPDSTAEQLAVDRVSWMWSGALTADSATVVAGVPGDARVAALRLEPQGDGPTIVSPEVEISPERIARMHVEGLEPDTAYGLTVLVDGSPDAARGVGSLRTAAVGPMSFRVAVSSCARVGSNGAVFDAIADADPLLYLQLGDFHYGNLDRADAADFRAADERQLIQPGQAALYRHVPIAYVWDDHDYGPNDAGADSPTRTAARTSYRQMVPHHPLVHPGDAPIQQAFTIGRVRFVLTDNRSERTADSMLGDEQEQWLVSELTEASRTHALVVWGNPSPWIGEANPASDTWAGWPEQRRRISDALAAAEVDNLIMLSGDAHMVAFDDGSHTDYSTDGAPGFPLLHAAALDRPGGVKGGPYSGGTFPGGGQYGLLDVRDDGSTIEVTLSGWTWDGEQLLRHEVVVPGPER